MDEMINLNELPMQAIDLNNPIESDLKKVAILKEEKEKAINESMIKIASFDTRTQDPYPSPFLNLSDTQIPRTTSEIFRWCKYFYTFDPLISGAINALATFPVTEVTLEDNENINQMKEGKQSDSYKLYERIFFKELNIYKLLIEIGIDYFLYGNCFIFGEMWNNPLTGGLEWKNMVRLDPSKIIIDYNPATQEKKYKWQVSSNIVRIVKSKRPKEEYDKIPQILREAAMKNSAIVLNSNNVYHFSRPTDSMGDNNIWGIPVVANVLKLLMYRNILRQAQEAIAREHIVPMRVYYMQKTQDYNPAADWNAVANAFAGELMKSVRDPNHKVVSPVPIGVINVGGEGRALLLTPEIEQVQSEILAGMNVPREFIFGGISYSGSSISLKILENQFITYRLLQKDFLQNFVIKNMAKARKEWIDEQDDENLISVKLTDLKMQDDVQQKSLVIQLNQSGKISDDFMWKVLGIDSDKMKAAIKKETLERLEFDTELKLAQLDAELKIKAKQMELESKLRDLQAKLMPETVQPEIMPNQIPQNNNVNVDVPVNVPVPQKGLNPTQENSNEIPMQENEMQALALKLLKINKQERDNFLNSLPVYVRTMLLQKIQELEGARKLENRNDKNVKIDMRQMPMQRPPRRESLKS